MISGYVFNEDESVYNNPAVTITNLDTCREWTAVAVETSNYYQLTLLSCADIIAGETLRFDAMSPDESQWNVTEHAVTQDEVTDGGIFTFNITLASPAVPPALVEYTISNRTITPPQTTEIDVKFSEEVEWKIAIENGAVIYDWTGTSANPNKRTWSGTYEGNGTIVPDGTYTVNITWTNTTTDLGGQNNTETITVSTSIDPDPPVITNIANTTPTTDSVTLTWTTDKASDSLVRYGTVSGTYTNSESDAAMVTSHSITLTGLSSDTTYYFVVNSTDASDNSNESEEHSFTMAAVGPPELISCVITPAPPVVQGTNVSIDCLFSEGVNYGIRIENATGALIENIGSGTATNPDPKWWNTTTGTPAGTYTINVTMDNSTSGLSSYNDTNTIEVTDASDITPPAVTDYVPTGTGALISTNITATFNEAINPDTLNNETVTIEHNGTAVAGNITYDAPSKTVTLDPADDLNYSETYNATITTGVQDIAGNNMSSNITWNFTTGSTDAIISIGNASGNVTVPIVIENAANVGSAHINITYNASVCMITDVANGTFDLTFANLEHNETILANVTFRSNSTNGTSSLNLSVTTLKDATPDSNEIPYSVQNGTYTAVLNGDVNGDGVVDIADAMYLAKHVLGITGFEKIIEEAADVNDDGVIDIADAMYLAKHVLGKSGFEELR
jgi:hypothetical protein